MNFQGAYRMNLPIKAWDSGGRVFLELGDGYAAMPPAEAREMAAALTAAANNADPLVKLEGLQASNDDLTPPASVVLPA